MSGKLETEESARDYFEKVLKILGPRSSIKLLSDGLEVYFRRMSEFFGMISRPESLLANRIAGLIRSSDPDASIKFEKVADWDEMKDLNQFQRSILPIAIYCRGNFPDDLEEKVHEMVKSTLEEIAPGFEFLAGNYRVYFEALPPEIGPDD